MTTECDVCGAPATIVWMGTHAGVGFGNNECLVTLGRIQCAAGHWYDEELDAVEYPLGEES